MPRRPQRRPLAPAASPVAARRRATDNGGVPAGMPEVRPAVGQDSLDWDELPPSIRRVLQEAKFSVSAASALKILHQHGEHATLRALADLLMVAERAAERERESAVVDAAGGTRALGALRKDS